MQRKQTQKQRQFPQQRQQTGYAHPAMTFNDCDADREAPEATAAAMATLRRPTMPRSGDDDIVGSGSSSSSNIHGNEKEPYDDDEASGEAADDVALLDCVAHAQANVTIRESSDCVYQQRHHQHQHCQHGQDDKLVGEQLGGDIGFRNTTWFAPAANALGHAFAAAASAGSTSKDAKASKGMRTVCKDENV